MLVLLQQYSNISDVIDNRIFDFEKIDDEFYNFLLNKELTKARTYLIERSYNYDELFRNLFDNFIPRLPKNNQSQVILLIAEYQYKNAFVIDKEINATALLLEIIGCL